MARQRTVLADAHAAAVRAVEGRNSVARWLADNPLDGVWQVVAVGKAAGAMTLGARDALGDRLASALVVTREGYASDELRADGRFEILEAAHPVPDARSLRAGERVLDRVADAGTDERFLFLVSGGASSLVEALPEGGSAEALAELNRRLLADGLDIQAMNRIRRAVSRVKGGRLGVALGDREAVALLISDVPGDDPTVIGSGLLFAPPPGEASVPGHVPEAYRGLCPAAEPGPDQESLPPMRHAIVASNRIAREAASDHLRAAGFTVTQDDTFLEGEARALGERLGQRARGLTGALVMGGEPTVTLPAASGRGGRMQALALSAAVSLEGVADAWLLAAGTDGADGPTEDAGAIVDGGTIERGRVAGLDARDCLDRADAGRFLDASGDLLRTGPTGTNVMDIVIALGEGR